MYYRSYLLIAIAANFLWSSSSASYTHQIAIYEQNENNKQLAIDISLEPEELLYKQSIKAISTNPNFNVSEPLIKEEATILPDKKEGYKNDVTVRVGVENKNKGHQEEGTIQLHFLTNSKKPNLITVPVSFTTQAPVTVAKQVAQPLKNVSEKNELSLFQKITQKVSDVTHRWYQSLTSLFEDTGSPWLKYLLALLLGILLSLTPCIYPMIPVTIGILQANQSSSPLKNFLLAIAYTLGISTTFALLGFIAALGGTVFGQLQTSIWFMLPIVAILFYLGFAMFGLYEMYIPRFMQNSQTQVKGGSFGSAFIFGALSGTVASPCMSPGLALIIGYVNHITHAGSILSYLSGFLLLFAFGIGTSLPLLIIGTFSSSINFLPQAGMWMVEVKRILGLMLIGMAFYYAQNIVPFGILIWIIAALLIALGIYYFSDVKVYDSVWAARYKYLMGALLILGACYSAYMGIKHYLVGTNHNEHASFWMTDYEAARAKAIAEKKKLFLDFSTTWCGACKKLDKDVLSRPDIQELLKHYVPVKIDATDPETQPYARLEKTLAIQGYPTLTILDPQKETAVKQWLGYISAVEPFKKELAQYK